MGGQRDRRRAHVDGGPGGGRARVRRGAGRAAARVRRLRRGPHRLRQGPGVHRRPRPGRAHPRAGRGAPRATYLLGAPRLTSGELRQRLTQRCLAIDPEAAARRYRRAVTTRQVVGYLSRPRWHRRHQRLRPARRPSGRRLRPGRRAGRAASPRGPPRHDHPDPGRRLPAPPRRHPHRPHQAEVIATLLAEAAQSSSTAPDDTADDAPPRPDSGANLAPASTVRPAIPPGAAKPSGGAAPESAGPVEVFAPGGAGRAGLRAWRSGSASPRYSASTSAPARSPPGVRSSPRWPAISSRRHRRAPWRFAVVDDKGHLLLAGTTRRRPRPSSPSPKVASSSCTSKPSCSPPSTPLSIPSGPRSSPTSPPSSPTAGDTAPRSAHIRRNRHARGPLAAAHPGARPHLCRPRLPPGPRPPMRRRPHALLRGERRHHRGQRRPALPPPPRAQALRRLAAAPPPPRPLPLAQPARRGVLHPRRADHAAAARAPPRPAACWGPLLPHPATSKARPIRRDPATASARRSPAAQAFLLEAPPPEDPDDPAPF